MTGNTKGRGNVPFNWIYASAFIGAFIIMIILQSTFYHKLLIVIVLYVPIAILFLVLPFMLQRGLKVTDEGISIPMTYWQWMGAGFNDLYSFEEIEAVYPFYHETALSPDVHYYGGVLAGGMYYNITGAGDTVFMGYCFETTDGKKYIVRSRSNILSSDKTEHSKETKIALRKIAKAYRKKKLFMVKEVPFYSPEQLLHLDSIARDIQFKPGTDVFIGFLALAVTLVLLVFLLFATTNLPFVNKSNIYIFFLVDIFISPIPAIMGAVWFYRRRTKLLKWANKYMKYLWALDERVKTAPKKRTAKKK